MVNMQGGLVSGFEKHSLLGLDVYDNGTTFECRHPYLYLYFISIPSTQFFTDLVSQNLRNGKEKRSDNYFLAYKDYASQLAGVSDHYPEVRRSNINITTLTHTLYWHILSSRQCQNSDTTTQETTPSPSHPLATYALTRQTHNSH